MNYSNYNPILYTENSTVVSEYEPTARNRMQYQSEAELEDLMIKQLQSQGYEYLDVHSSKELELNLRRCLEILNDCQFSDNEWTQFFSLNIANKSDGIKEKTRKIQQDYIQTLTRDDGTVKNIKIIEKDSIFKNKLQVIHQYSTSGNHDNIYDVTILVNGLPLIHCELKRRGVPIREAFNQIDRYQRDSFWVDSGLFEYVQIFVISNGTDTKYYSNSTRFEITAQNNGKIRRKRNDSTSFEFTNHWADAKNNNIHDIEDFTKYFFSQQTILNILTKYCVFTANENLLVMRPYQIVATERILNQIEIANNYNRWGTIDAGGYIWHTTGSGKTLTSFKTAQLASQKNCVDKVLFVVDRQDLDYQTMCEYEKFQKGAVNGNKSTSELDKQLQDDNVKIIVTTIQKLGIFAKRNDVNSIYGKRVVLIFDECHRSQFGEMHKIITKRFKKYAIFGFTGTPIFAQNSISSKNPVIKTTEQVFGKQLHVYTVVNAINDNNVLPFKIDYVNTVKENKGDFTLIEAIDDEKVLLSPQRVSNVVDYILKNYRTKTNSGSLNSIFATSSINAAKAYYQEFKQQQKDSPNPLKVSLIYSYNANGENIDDFDDEDSDSTDALSIDDRTFLDVAIDDYNKMFQTTYDTGKNFKNYYKDVSKNMKERKLDILIVVDMFLTGFDAKCLGALWLDKRLQQHRLIQAFSRTNRILDSTKHHGNIICFQNLRKEVDDAVALFGDEKAKGIVILKTFDDYYNGYNDENGKHVKGYVELVAELQIKYPLPVRFLGNNSKKEFICLMGSLLRVQNILRSFDEFAGKDLIEPGVFQDYLSVYNDLHDEFKVSENILELISKYHKKNITNKTVGIEEIKKAVNSNPALRPKRELIEQFIDTLNSDSDVNGKWLEFKNAEKEKYIIKLINDGVKGKPLNKVRTRLLIDRIFRAGIFEPHYLPSDSDIAEILPNGLSFFGTIRMEAKNEIEEKLKKLFEIYYD